MGRTRIELLSSGDIDMYDDVSSPLTFAIADIRRPDQRDSAFSKTIKVPATKGNNIRFGHIFDINLKDGTYNPNLKAPCTLYIDDIPQISGFLQILNIEIDDKNDFVYNITIKGNVNNIFQTLGDDELTDLDWSDLNHTLSVTNQYNSWSNTYANGYCYPLIDYGFDNTLNQYKAEHLMPAVFLRTYIDRIFSNAGFTYSSTFFDSARFKNLIIPCTGESFKYSSTQVAARLFEASRSTQQTIANNATYPVNSSAAIAAQKQLSFNTDVNDPANAFNTATGKWSPPADGYYDLYAECNLNTSGTIFGGTTLYSLLSIRKYDTATSNYTIIDSEYAQVNSVATIFKVDAGNVFLKTTDQIDIVIFAWSGTYANTSTIQWQFNPTNSKFYNRITAANYQEGDTVTMVNCIPNKVKQKDLLLDIIRMFNLYVETDKNNSNKLLIETRDDFYSSGTTIDWTYKLDNSKPLELTPMGELDYKNFKYSYKEDKDFYNKKYVDAYKVGYGNREFEVVNEFLKNTNETKTLFSATPLVADSGDDRVIPRIWDIDNTNQTKFKPFNLRLLYNGGIKSCVNSWIHGGTNAAAAVVRTTYLYAGHLDSVTAPTFDLNFAVPREVYYDAKAYTNANLFNLYHKKYIDEITDKDSKIVTGYFYLTPYDIAKLDFRNSFYFEGQLFRLNKIYDYNPIDESVTKCEFIKIKEGRSFGYTTSTINGGLPDLIDGLLVDTTPVPQPPDKTRTTIVYGENNVVSYKTRNSYINGDYNYVHGGNNINLLGSSGNTIYDGLENVTLINTSGTTVYESNTLYVNGYQITSGTIASLSSAWYNTPFNSADYSEDGTSDVWTVASGNITTNKYIVVGKTMTWCVVIQSSSLTGTNLATQLRITIPANKTALGTVIQSCVLSSNSTLYPNAYVSTSGASVYIQSLGLPVISNGTVDVLAFNITFEIQ